MSNQLNQKLTGVPRRMLMTTRARVEEQQRADKLLEDPTIAQWWQYLEWDSQLDSFYTSMAQLSWVVRSKICDRITEKHLTNNPDALVIELGAGLSTRYHRVGQNCRCWLDLDLPSVTALRRQLDTESDRHRFLSYSVMDFDWLNEIPDCNPESLLIIAEGLLMYFELEQVRDFVNHLQTRFSGATLIFDVVGFSPKSKGAKQFASLGAPLKWFIKNEKDIEELGLSLVQVKSLVQENCRYPNRIGFYRWIPWLSKLSFLRNASLIVEITI
ncbi:MAG: class I SAM-dependent methyltransferase [Cyanobacteria bacterium P01_F01_bin.143]